MGLIFQGFLATPSRVSLLTSIRGVGAVGVAALCCQTLDLKVLIAFTSVGHMALVVIGAALGTHLRATVSVLVLLRHGFSSSLGFFMAFVLYKLTGSRSLLINKSLIGAGVANRLMGIHSVSVNWVAPRYKRLGRDVRLLYFFSGRREAHKMPGIDCLNKRRIRFYPRRESGGVLRPYI